MNWCIMWPFHQGLHCLSIFFLIMISLTCVLSAQNKLFHLTSNIPIFIKHVCAYRSMCANKVRYSIFNFLNHF